MSHELDTTNGRTAFADSRNDAWHGLGQKVGHLMTAEEVMKEAMLGGWNVRKEPLFASVGGEVWTGEWNDDSFNGMTPVPVPDKYATVRTNPVDGKPNVLGVVGRNYRVIQNEQSTDFLNALTDESGAHFETAGALRGGRETFVTMKLPESMELTTPAGTIDTTNLYLGVLNSHDGNTPFRVVCTPVRIVCKNTQTAALRNLRSYWAARHTDSATQAIEQARQALSLSFRYLDAFQEEADKMIQTTIDEDFARKAISEVFDVEASETSRTEKGRVAHVDRVMELYKTSETLTDIRGTRYGLYNAVTEYVDHFWPRGGASAGVPAESQLFGQYADLKSTAFNRLLVKS